VLSRVEDGGGAADRNHPRIDRVGLTKSAKSPVSKKGARDGLPASIDGATRRSE